jgi:hypothetical protein
MPSLLSKLAAALKPTSPTAFPTRLDNLEALVRGAKCTPGGAVIVVADEAMRAKAFELGRQVQVVHNVDGMMYVVVATSMGRADEYGVPVMIHTDVITMMAGEMETPCLRCSDLSAKLAHEHRDRELETKKLFEELGSARVEANELRKLIYSPIIDNFLEAVRLEAAHQVDRWKSPHDAGKHDSDWYWLLGYLGGKLIHRPNDSLDKQLHWIISIAAVCFNWWRAKTGEDRRMRPGTMRADGGE